MERMTNEGLGIKGVGTEFRRGWEAIFSKAPKIREG
jgi:hypothetical protein